jgi:hypothetical protein
VDEVPSGWPGVEVEVNVEPPGPLTPTRITPESASLALVGGGRLRASASPRRAVFTVPEPLTPSELVHPNLAPVAALFAYWAGYETFHAGGVAGRDGVWGVVGDRTAGKSSLLGWLAGVGWKVVGDDLLVISRGTVFAAPRCIDLREPIPLEMEQELPVHSARADTRRRVELPQIAPEWTMAGWLLLAWGEETRLQPVPPAERLSTLARSRSVTQEPPDPAEYLRVASLPMFRLIRPRRWDVMPRVLEALVDVIGARPEPDVLQQ